MSDNAFYSEKYNLWDDLKEINELAIKKYGPLDIATYTRRLKDEREELNNSLGPIEHCFELFDVIAFTYALVVTGLNIPHDRFIEALASKATLVKEKMKIQSDDKLLNKGADKS